MVFFGRFFESIRSFKAGNNFLLARSPVTPKITTILAVDFFIIQIFTNISKQKILIVFIIKKIISSLSKFKNKVYEI